jgi:hypothetical protein
LKQHTQRTDLDSLRLVAKRLPRSAAWSACWNLLTRLNVMLGLRHSC